MAHRELAETTASISELKNNPHGPRGRWGGHACRRAQPHEPAKAYEQLMDLVEDLELHPIADARLDDDQTPVPVNLDEL